MLAKLSYYYSLTILRNGINMTKLVQVKIYSLILVFTLPLYYYGCNIRTPQGFRGVQHFITNAEKNVKNSKYVSAIINYEDAIKILGKIGLNKDGSFSEKETATSLIFYSLINSNLEKNTKLILLNKLENILSKDLELSQNLKIRELFYQNVYQKFRDRSKDVVNNLVRNMFKKYNLEQLEKVYSFFSKYLSELKFKELFRYLKIAARNEENYIKLFEFYNAAPLKFLFKKKELDVWLGIDINKASCFYWINRNLVNKSELKAFIFTLIKLFKRIRINNEGVLLYPRSGKTNLVKEAAEVVDQSTSLNDTDKFELIYELSLIDRTLRRRLPNMAPLKSLLKIDYQTNLVSKPYLKGNIIALDDTDCYKPYQLNRLDSYLEEYINFDNGNYGFGTLLLVDCGKIYTGQAYFSMGTGMKVSDAFQHKKTLKIIDLSKKAVIYKKTFLGSLPPKVKYSGSGGSEPVDEMAEFVKNIPFRK